MAESLKNKTVRGAGWSFADNIANRGITFLVSIVLARLLTPGEYGLIGIIGIFIAVFNSIVDSGFSNALIRKKNVDDLDYNTVFISNLIISVLMAGAMYASAPTISRFFKRPELLTLTQVMSSIVVINAFAIVQRTILRKRIDFKTQMKCSVIASISSGIVGIGMALKGFGVWSLAGQQISRQLLNAICLWIFNRWIPRLQFSWSRFKEMFDFGWKLMVSRLIDTLWQEIYQVVIGKFYTADSLGQYTRAKGFANMCSSNITGVVQRVSYPALSQIQDDKKRLKAGYQKVIRVTMLVTFVLMLGMAGTAKQLILVLVGDQWIPAIVFLQIICFRMMLYPLQAINLNMLQVQGRSELFLKLEIIKKAIAVIPLLLGIFINIYWMLIGSVFSSVIAYYLNAYYSGPFLDYSMKDQIRDILPSFGIALSMGLIVYAMSFIPVSPFILLPIQIIIGAGFVIGICEMIKLPEYQEIKGIGTQYLNKLRKK